MSRSRSTAPAVMAGVTALLLGSAIGSLTTPTTLAGQQTQGQGRGGRGGGRGGGNMAPALFTVMDENNDGAVTRDEFRAAFERWFTAANGGSGSLTAAQLTSTLTSALPAPPAGGGQQEACGGRSSNPTVACPGDVEKMMAALPTEAPAKPAKPRKILVLGHAAGFVHSSIPLAAKTVEALGDKTGAWKTTITYDPAQINAANLKQYDAIFLASTTGCFLDDPNDKAATDARRAAFLDFIRSGKGIAAIHAATDSYHGTACGGGPAAAPAGGGGPAAMLAGAIVNQGGGGDSISRQQMMQVADTWFDRLDSDKTGKLSRDDFAARFIAALGNGFGGGRRGAAAGAATTANAAAPQPPGGNPLWPEWNKIIGGYFKFHWVDPQLIWTKIDDPKSPLTAMFHGQEFEIHDETYTYNQESFSRRNVHVLTSIDYDKMSAEDKAKESNPRTDHDYALSWVRREGQGRLFYEAHGHSERIYAIRPMLEHVLAGIQYALGDLKADDSPSMK
jgi:type 1 glutamine amidotransferase